MRSLFHKLDVYLGSLIDKAKITTQEKVTYVWEEEQLREGEMYLQNFNMSTVGTPSCTSTRTPGCTFTRTTTSIRVVPSHRRRPTAVNVFVKDEASDDGDVISTDEEEDVTNVFSQADLDFLDDRSIESSSLNSFVRESDQRIFQPSVSSSLTENCQDFDDVPEFSQTNEY